MNRSDGTSVFWWRVRAVALVGALVLAGCGGGGDDDASSKPDKTDTSTAPGDTSEATDVEVDDEDDGEQQIGGGEPVSHVPFDGEAPDGYRMIPGECDATADALAAAEEAGQIEYPSPIVFAVLKDWVDRGKGSGGSGGVTGTSVELRYESPESDDVRVGFEWDNRNSDGEIQDDDAPWESYDYEYETEGTTTMIEYEQVATVAIQEQTVDLFYRDPSQAPDLIDGEEYKARVSMFDLPYSLFSADGIDTYSVVFTITFDSEDSGIDQDVVEAIVGSVSLPTCVWDELLLFEESSREADLNGDGEVMTMEEFLAEIQKDLDEAMAAEDD